MSPARVRIVARFGVTSSGLPPYVMISLLGHVVFVVVLLFLPHLRPSKPFPDNPLVVDLVAAPRPARAEASTPAATPPPPAESPPPDVARMETRTPPPVEPLPEKIEPAKDPEPRKEPEPQPPPRRTEAEPAPGEASEGLIADDGASSIAPLEGGDVEFAWYRSAVTAALYGRWRRPLLERLMEPIEVQVSFEIQRNGSVQGLRIDRSSGVPTLDRTALRAVSDANPLPPLPPNWRDAVLPATFVFRLHPE